MKPVLESSNPPSVDRPVSLPAFGFLAITGRDALKFFQGYTTCDLATLDETHPGLGATCNIQGRMLANYRIAVTGTAHEPGFLLRLDRALVTPLLDFLKKYSVFSKVSLTDVSDDYHCYGYWGLPGDQDPGCLVVPVPAQVPRYEVWSPASRALGSQDEQQADLTRWQRADLDAGIVWVQAANREEFIPQMLNLHQLGGISFNKGCYLGQEIVARMQYRGQLKRRLCRSHASDRVSPGDSLVSDTGAVRGQVVSSVDDQFLAVVQLTDKEKIYLPGSSEALELHEIGVQGLE